MNQWRKGIASWRVGNILYLSIPFTWMLSKARILADAHKGKVMAGGPAVALAKKNGCDDLSWAETPESAEYDTLSFHNPLATFTSRGCPNRCEFCAVPKIEPEFTELDTWKPAPVVCDNNLLACSLSHFHRVIESLLPFPYVDFNQGLDARLLTGWHIAELSRLQHAKIRFAFNRQGDERHTYRAVTLCQSHGFKDLGVYCLVGFDDTPAEARDRLEQVRAWGIRPNAMRYQPLDALSKNSHVADGWTEAELRKIMNYYNHLRWYEHIPYDSFDRYPFQEPIEQGCLL